MREFRLSESVGGSDLNKTASEGDIKEGWEDGGADSGGGGGGGWERGQEHGCGVNGRWKRVATQATMS